MNDYRDRGGATFSRARSLSPLVDSRSSPMLWRPHFISMTGLVLLRHREFDLPFIVVSGTTDEEIAATIHKARRPQTS